MEMLTKIYLNKKDAGYVELSFLNIDRDDDRDELFSEEGFK